MNIKEIAESITEDPNIILEADPTRRDFLKRSAGTAAAAAKGDLLGAVTSAAGVQKPNIQALIQGYDPSADPFADVSDEELTETPESEWVFTVPYSRLLRIMKEHGKSGYDGLQGGYVNVEISQKIGGLAEYLVGGIKLSSMPEYNEIMKVVNRMKKAAEEAGVFDASAMMANVGTNLGYHFEGYEGNTSSAAARAVHALNKLCKDSGLGIPKEMVINTVNDARSRAEYLHKEWTKRAESKKNKRLKGKAKTPKSSVEKGRALSKSGEAGGLPPLQPRSITRRQRDFPYKDTSLASKAESPYPTFESKLSKVLYDVILETDPTRRDFLKRSAGTAAAAAKGDLLGAVTSAAGVQKPNIQSLIQGYDSSKDPYARYSDEQLSGMINDNNFINTVPYARLVRIAANYWMGPTTLDLSNKDMEFGWECTEDHARGALEHLIGLLPLRFEEEFMKLSKSDGRTRPISDLVGIFKKLIGTMGQDELEETGLIDAIESKWSPTDRIGLKSQNAHFSSSLVGAIADRISLFACGDRGDGILPDEEYCDTFGCDEEELKHHPPASASGMSIITQAAKRLSSVANDIGVKTTPSDIENIADASLVSWDPEYEVSESPAKVLEYFQNLFAKFDIKVPRSSIISGLKNIVDRAHNWATSYNASQEAWNELIDKKAKEYQAKTSKLKKQKGKAKTPKSSVEKGRTLSKSGETGGLPPLEPRSMTRRQRGFPYKDASLTGKAESPYPTFESKLDEELTTINELFFRPSYKYKVTIEYRNPAKPGVPYVITKVVEADSANEAFAYVHTSFCEDKGIDPHNLDIINDFVIIRDDGKEFTKDSKGFDYGSGWATEWHPTSAVDPLKHIPDEELIDTPERQWITKIPYSRLLNIIKSVKPSSANWNSQYNIGYAKGELIVKTSMLAPYICQGLQPSPGGYNDNLARKVSHAISETELLRYLLSAMKEAGINFTKRDEELLIESMIDSIRVNESCSWNEEIAHALSKVCGKIGLKISAEDISRKYEEISNLTRDDDFEDDEDDNDYTL